MTETAFQGREVRDAVASAVRDLGALAQRLGPIAVRRIEPGADKVDEEWLRGLPEGATQWVFSVGGSETALDSESTAELTAEVASFLQDAVVDETGRPWPDIDGFGVLDVRVLGTAAWWVHNDSAFARVGELAKRGERPHPVDAPGSDPRNLKR